MYLQGGEFFSEGGDVIKPLPKWVKEAIEETEPASLAEAGYPSEGGQNLTDATKQ